MKKIAKFKMSIVLIALLLLSCFIFVNCNKPDKEREQISIKRLNLKYVKEKDPDFFIDSLSVNINDENIGQKVNLNNTDYQWALDLLMEGENNKEIYEIKKPNTFKVKLIFAEYGWTFEHDTSKYDGKQSTFYISKKLRNQFIEQYLSFYPINIVLEKTKYNWDDEIYGFISIREYTPVDQGLILLIEGNNEYIPIKVIDLIPKNTPTMDVKKFISFTFRLSDYRKVLKNSSNVYLDIKSSDGTLDYEQYELPLMTNR
ncbi:hypothetical protein [Gottfriedia luciferensis]|uniref:hypothetical protein n=1 Tax=Gottfriedia luciferensis TaxID=178774 RepID=UPI000B454BD5|nr:hypothetical protein [Gottfriedia luciferensis]